ncbi:MAG TPA: hypothetical protein ENK19_06320 [Acidobacteria bacterium]|nr:hypothetical protein [Acidobacteriota bacterium]
MDDLLNFYLSTEYATKTLKGLNDALRRFNNVIEVAGGYSLSTTEEAKGVIRLYQDYIQPREQDLQQALVSHTIQADYSKAFRDRIVVSAEDFLIFDYVVDAGLTTTIDGRVIVGEGMPDGSTDDTLNSIHRSNRVVSDADWLEGTESNDLMLGESGDDVLIAGGGDDVLIGGDGDDTLDGEVGNDVYVIHPDEGDDTILDADGQGVIRLEAATLSGVNRPSVIRKGRTTWQTQVNGKTLYYRLISGDLTNGARLEISGPALGGGSVTLDDFKNGDLGITLDTSGLIELVAGTGANPIDSPDYQPQGGQTRLTEGGARLFTVYLNAPAEAGDRIRLGVDQLAGALRVITGDTIRSFGNGTIELDLQPGQSAITFALWDKAPIDASRTLTLTASLLRQGADPAAAPRIDYTIELEDLQDPATASGPTGNTILGDQEPLRDANGHIVHDAWGNIIPVGGAPGRADTIYDTPLADLIQAGGGDDLVRLFRGGEDVVDGGAGDDTLIGAILRLSGLASMAA